MDHQNPTKSEDKVVTFVDSTEKVNKLEAKLSKMSEKVNKLEAEKEKEAVKMVENKLELDSVKKELAAFKLANDGKSSPNEPLPQSSAAAPRPSNSDNSGSENQRSIPNCLFLWPALYKNVKEKVGQSVKCMQWPTDTANAIKANDEAISDEVKTLKLNVRPSEKSMRSSHDDDYFLVHQKDYNVVTKIIGDTSDSATNSSLQIIGDTSDSATNSSLQQGQILISFKANSSAEDKKERQFVWNAVNETYLYLKGVRGKIYMPQEIMDELKIEANDEVTIQPLDDDDAEKSVAKLIKIQINHCDGNAKCPNENSGNASKTVFFHANDIVNSSFKKAFSGKIMNLNVAGHLDVKDEEIKNGMQKFQTNLFEDEMDGDPKACIKFRISEIQGNMGEQIQSAAGSTKELSPVENIQFGMIKNDTIIEIETIDAKLIIFGIEGQTIAPPKLFDQNGWNLHENIGGLSEELDEIFEHAFSPRMFPPDCRMGLKNVRGILLHGPPGTGKTLIAHEVGKALNSREPKVLSGADVQSCWYGQSEKNVRTLFVDAEREQALAGDQSALHVIIIDELDSLCPNRKNSNDKTDQRIVNTLLAKLDGVQQLNNILIIGMTNFLDTIDPALLRPGRLELQIKIGLPNEKGREEILEIHTKTMRESNRLNEDVNLAELAKKTINYSGAELEGLVRAAKSQAMKRFLNANKQQNVKENTANEPNYSELKICAVDFELAFEKNIKPAFGKGSKDGEYLKQILCREPILWSSKIEKLLEKGANLVEELRNSDASVIGQSRLLLLNGPMKSGKTFLATIIAQRAEIPYIRFVNVSLMLNSSNFEDKTPKGIVEEIISECENTDFSCIIFEKVEQIITGNESWIQAVLQMLAEVFNQQPSKGKRLLLIATSCAGPDWFEQIGMHSCLQNRIELPGIDKFDDAINFLAAATKQGKTMDNVENEAVQKWFTKAELDAISKIGAKFDSKMAPTVKDLVQLTEWYSKGEEASADKIAPFKQRLIELIDQQKKYANVSAAQLSMYR